VRSLAELLLDISVELVEELVEEDGAGLMTEGKEIAAKRKMVYG
jgi:hypothetical protein